MSKARVSSVTTNRVPFQKGMLRIGLLLSFTALSASSFAQPKTRNSDVFAKMPRSYCSSGAAPLGTGLVAVEGRAETNLPPHKAKRWTGWVRAFVSGRYEFKLPEGVGQITVNNEPIFERLANSSQPHSIEIEMTTNRLYAISVETPKSEDPSLELQWRRPDGRLENVPTNYLYAPVATASTGDKNDPELY